jgi:hypothetical protein
VEGKRLARLQRVKFDACAWRDGGKHRKSARRLGSAGDQETLRVSPPAQRPAENAPNQAMAFSNAVITAKRKKLSEESMKEERQVSHYRFRQQSLPAHRTKHSNRDSDCQQRRLHTNRAKRKQAEAQVVV